MKIKQCRICHNKKLITIGSLGNIAISDFTDTPQEGTKYPLTLVYCKKCTLLQLDRNVPRDLLYKNYWYQSGLNPEIVKDLKEIAQYCNVLTHIDVGSNDGTLLKYSIAKYKIAVDPSNIVPKAGIWFNNYWEDIETNKADLITAIACLYDLPDPNKFIKNVKRHLTDHGLFISQFQPLEQMIELNDVGNICHEHSEYYSYKSLVRLFEQNGLEIFKVERNKMNGGSYRVFARHFKKGSIKFKEKEYGIKELKEFFKRIEFNKNKMLGFLKWAKLNEFKIVGFGASTKAATICQYYGISPRYIVDVNPDKKNKFTIYGSKIVTGIPMATTFLWVFPYGFLDYFKKKEKGYKGAWVTTIPEFKTSK